MKSRSDLFVLVAAGPSLDYCGRELADLDRRGAHFLISDSVAAAVLRKFRPRNASVFTVELRRHGYLRRIGSFVRFDVAAYRGANARNLRFSHPVIVSRFKLNGEEGIAPALYSPGTVLGVMLSYAISAIAATGEIHLFGADFCYLDNQVYSRCIGPHEPLFSRVSSRETWQYEMALKKSSGFITRLGYAIRTSFELLQSRENMRALVERIPEGVRLFEYSPIGLDCERVTKLVPENLTK